jgi:ubiquinone/menaquinone biosynthesis C-methylase UbiE
MPPTEHLDRIRAQFTRQADAYVATRQARDWDALRGLVRLSRAGPGSRVLDVACGPGLLTIAFAERCAEAVGLDATEALLARARAAARERGLGNVVFQAGDARRLPHPDDTFDVVACRAALHHFEAPAEVLREMSRVARPGGTLLVADFLSVDDADRAARHNRLERLCDPTHVRALSEGELRGLVEQEGLEVVASPTGTIDYDVEEWLAHGGPPAEARAEIRRLLQESLDVDRLGLDVRREEGLLRFSHRTIALVLRVPSAGTGPGGVGESPRDIRPRPDRRR